MKETSEISVTEAVKLTGYSRQTIYNLVRDGIVAARKHGWEIWIDRRSLLAYCAKRQTQVG
jgi:excisionase family DNA binding protein